MSRKYIFSEVEYNSLRSELVSRIGLINSQSSTALTTIISTWAVGLTLLIFFVWSNFCYVLSPWEFPEAFRG